MTHAQLENVPESHIHARISGPEWAYDRLRSLHPLPLSDMCASDPRTWELAAPTIDASSSLCLPHSTNLWQSSEEEAMSWWGL